LQKLNLEEFAKKAREADNSSVEVSRWSSRDEAKELFGPTKSSFELLMFAETRQVTIFFAAAPGWLIG
jgi:hypothetical protein